MDILFTQSGFIGIISLDEMNSLIALTIEISSAYTLASLICSSLIWNADTDVLVISVRNPCHETTPPLLTFTNVSTVPVWGNGPAESATLLQLISEFTLPEYCSFPVAVSSAHSVGSFPLQR